MTSDEMSLWDVENTVVMPKVREMFVAAVSQRETDEFCRRYHYTGTGNNTAWRWGLWADATLYGVVGYNLPTRSLCESVFGAEHHEHVWHMGRLAMADESPRNSESRLIGGSLARIEREHPGVWAVVTYADTLQHHVGYVYQATNALYTGVGSIKNRYVDESGNIRPTYDGSVGGWVSSELAIERGWRVEQGKPKHRYLYILGNKTQRRERRRLLKWPVLPDYPKTVGVTNDL